jgi:hypothetical protein
LELNSGIGCIGTGVNEDGKFLPVIASNVGNVICYGILTEESVKVIARPNVTYVPVADHSKFDIKKSIDCCAGNTNVNVNAGNDRLEF